MNRRVFYNLPALLCLALLAAAGEATPDGSAMASSRDVASAAGGATIRITGAGFSAAPEVHFGGVPATRVVVIDAGTLEVTVPAHPAGVVDIEVGGRALAQPFEFLQAPTRTFASHDFEDGTLGPYGVNAFRGTVTASAERAYAGRQSAKCAVTGAFSGSGAALSYDFSANPTVTANGIYLRWYQYIPSGTVTDVSARSHQIKLHLFRRRNDNGQPGWLMPGIGSDFPPSNGTLTAFIDNGILTIPGGATGVRFGDGAWHEIQIWMQRRGGTGRARMWIDGRQRFDVTNRAMGSDDASAGYTAMFGVAYSESGGPVTAYVDNVVVADGFIQP